MELVPNMKLWLSTEDGENVIGGGRCRLLEAIDELGSLSAAAEQLGMSYRKAWGDLKKAESNLGHTLIVKSRGGSRGGKTVLTPEGARLLKLFNRFKADVKLYAEASFERLVNEAANPTA
ncbi:Molybdenum-pterin-binding protein MopB [Pontiella desulfatans]|uniref:Molybdenum-pterin-binding protein MopB n=1 Tax=Pontiella desulfatans TaxID=2750659 RepID=A0A6C2U6F7_PONDE|nr:LysR family transcriptional regulator [Pontiella desulfatans]VGO15483.1 Molybdenum-pterin-binding protein MopB [Pontiella desulfatans]